MFRSTSLSASHYAGKWAIPSEDQRIDLAVTNKLAIAYGVEPDSQEKEAKLLQLLETVGAVQPYWQHVVHRSSATQRDFDPTLGTSGSWSQRLYAVFPA